MDHMESVGEAIDTIHTRYVATWNNVMRGTVNFIPRPEMLRELGTNPYQGLSIRLIWQAHHNHKTGNAVTTSSCSSSCKSQYVAIIGVRG